MTTIVEPIKNIRRPLKEPFFVVDPQQNHLLSDSIVFYLEGASLHQELAGLRLYFSLDDEGTTLVFLGSDDTMYFAQFDRMAWIEQAMQVLQDGAVQGVPVYIETQLSGKPRGLLVNQERLEKDYSGLVKTQLSKRIPSMVGVSLYSKRHALPRAARI